ncbi:right-handed parallel beta-helix repeat-containing protein [candidate division KSB1 bacterium]|nr:right-handed parallel beta-helix repeat-containing protein [candidate division KSB1 bacterium]
MLWFGGLIRRGGWAFTLLAVMACSCYRSEMHTTTANVGPVTQPVLRDEYARIYYVAATRGSDHSGDGSMQKPWQTIQQALRNIRDSAPGIRSAVLVSQGEYSGETIEMKSHVDLLGGFDAVSYQRDIFLYPTVLMGREQQRLIIGADAAKLDGFVVTKASVRDKGAGIYCDGVSPTISNSVFIANQTLAPVPWNPQYLHETAHDGGAIYCRNAAAPTIENNMFAHNNTECGRGAAIALHGRCGGRIASNVFYSNTTGLNDPMRSSDGGAVSIFEWSNPLIENNIFLHNQALASNDAGALFVALWSAPTIKRNLFVGNVCGDDAGALFVGGQEHRYDRPLDALPEKELFFVTIDSNVFIGNSNPSKNSGAMRFTMESRGRFAHNVVANNSGIYFQRCEATIENNIILDNFLLIETKAGLQPSVIRENIIWGEFKLKTKAIVADNRFREKITENMNITPDFYDDREEIKIISAAYNPKKMTTSLLATGRKFNPDELVGRVVKGEEHWGVVKTNSGAELEIWGDLSGCLECTILPTYRLK